MKRYPCLVPKRYCRTDALVELKREGVDEYGSPFPAVLYEGKCNYQDSAKTIFTAEKKLVQLSGVALFPGDIAPELAVISGGTITVHGEKRIIFQGKKARNPDGSVNYCELVVM